MFIYLQYVDMSLSNAILKYDPTVTDTLIPAEVIAEHLNGMYQFSHCFENHLKTFCHFQKC
jgi:hypothetical protein